MCIKRLFLLFGMFLFVLSVYSQTRQSLEEQRRQIEREINETNRLLRESVREQEQSETKLNLLVAQLSQYNRLISGINAEVAYTERQINSSNEQIRQMTNDIEKMKTEYARLVYQAYKNRGQYNKLIYVLSAKDFNEAYRRMKYFQQYGEFRKRQVKEILVMQEELKVTIEKLTAQRAEREQLLAEHRRESEALQTVRAEHDREVSRLRANVQQLRTQLRAQQQKQQRVQQEIEKMLAEEARRRGTTPANPFNVLTPEERLISNNFRANRGRLPWPTERGTITGKFGPHRHPVERSVEINNTGIYITTVANADVRAVFDGEVSTVGGIAGWNMFVFIRHGNYITAYMNLVDVRVRQGDKVSIRETIGKVYTERGSQSATMQFMLYEGANRQNPELWITRM